MSLSTPDGLRMLVLGWQSECALRNRADLANEFQVAARLALPDTAAECVELGRSMLRVRIAESAPAEAPPQGWPAIVSGEITPADPNHVHTIDPDLREDDCAGCNALLVKWRETEIANERARRDRRMENLIKSARRLEELRLGHMGDEDATSDADAAILLAATMVVDILGDINDRLAKMNDSLITIAEGT